MTDAPRAISVNWPVLALAHDLGTISSTSSPFVLAIGFLRSPAVEVTDLSNVGQDRALYYESQYSDPKTLIDDFLSNYTTAASAADTIDASVTAAANAAVPGGNLANMAALAARQTLANTELTIAKGTDGAWNKSDVMLFMREGDQLYKCVARHVLACCVRS
jgi:hypothetical protein